MSHPTTTSAFPRRDVTDPSEWDRWAASLEELAIAAGRATVIAPHPDDETFGCGGLIADLVAHGTEVTIVTASDGSASHPGVARLAERRRAEQAAAVRALGCASAPVWLGLPDGDLVRCRGALPDGIAAAVADADLVVAPWTGDRHPDHEVVGQVAEEVSRQGGIRLIGYPVWLWRWGVPADAETSSCRRWILGESARLAKAAAIACYPSQTTKAVGDVIVDPEMIERFTRPFEVFIDA